MTRKELLKVEMSNYKDEIPLLDELYIIPKKEKHDSGYNYMQVVGVAKNYKKTLAYYSDVMQIWKLYENRKGLEMPLSMDIPEYGVIRFFSYECQFKVLYDHISDFVIELVRKEKQ